MRSSGTQAGFQLAGLLVTLGFAVVGGLITGERNSSVSADVEGNVVCST